MDIVIDIETLPDQSENAIQKYAEGLNVKCNLATKDDIGKALGLDAQTVKFTSRGDLEAQWVERFAKEAIEAQAREKWLKTSFDGGYGKILCIGYATDDKSVYCMTDADEKFLLMEFWGVVGMMCQGKPPYFIAHNAKFDLPFLWHRSVVNGVQPNRYFKAHGRHGTDHYCTSEAWAGYGNRISLSNLSKILGLEGKAEGMTGADVWPEYQKGNIEKIVTYCKQDVLTTYQIYKRLTFKD